MLKNSPSHPTFDALRSSVGPERANEVVRSIGVAVLHAAQGSLPGSLESIVTTMIGRLSQDEVAGLARGDMGVINRVQAMAEGHVKALQASQPATNQFAAQSGTASTLGGGQWINGVWIAKAGSGISDRGGNQFAELRAKGGATGDTSTGEGSGYSWLSAANQNIAGFSQAQVASAANFLKGAGLSREEVNDDTKHMVHLSKFRKEIGDFIKRKKDIERRKANGEDTSEDEAKLEEDKDKARKKMTPDQQRHFDDMRGIHMRNKADIAHDRDAARSTTVEQIVERHVKAAGSQTISEKAKAAIGKASSEASVSKTASGMDDAFGETTPPKTAEVKPSEPKPTEAKPERQASAAPAKPVRAPSPAA